MPKEWLDMPSSQIDTKQILSLVNFLEIRLGGLEARIEKLSMLLRSLEESLEEPPLMEEDL